MLFSDDIEVGELVFVAGIAKDEVKNVRQLPINIEKQG
jgi:hypothetical protein